jgi:predicted transcriptional regulator
MGRPRSPNKMIPLTIRVTPDLLALLDAVARARGQTRGEVLREVVARGMRDQDPPSHSFTKSSDSA